MNDTTDEKSCKKCKYFIPHYYWCNCKLKETAFGHCAKHRYIASYLEKEKLNDGELF